MVALGEDDLAIVELEGMATNHPAVTRFPISSDRDGLVPH